MAGGMLRTLYGSADDSTLSRGQGAAGHERLVLNAGITYQDVNERRVGGGDELPFTAFTGRAADAKVRALVTAGNELTLSLQYSERPRTPRYDELTPDYGQGDPSSAVYWFEPQRRDFVQLRWRGSDPTRAWHSAEAQVGQQVIEDGRRSRDFGSRNEDESLGLTFVAQKDLGAKHHLSYGMDVYRDDVASSRLPYRESFAATTVSDDGITGNLGDRRYREFGSGLDAAGRGVMFTLEFGL